MKQYLSSKAIWCQWVCVFVCSLIAPKRRTHQSWNFERWLLLRGADLLKNFKNWPFAEKPKNANSTSTNPLYHLILLLSNLLSITWLSGCCAMMWIVRTEVRTPINYTSKNFVVAQMQENYNSKTDDIDSAWYQSSLNSWDKKDYL